MEKKSHCLRIMLLIQFFTVGLGLNFFVAIAIKNLNFKILIKILIFNGYCDKKLNPELNVQKNRICNITGTKWDLSSIIWCVCLANML
jgi:hypothetical protein